MDDGSFDETKRVALEYVRKHTVDNVRVILLGKNYGKGEAIRKVGIVWVFHFLRTPVLSRASKLCHYYVDEFTLRFG